MFTLDEFLAARKAIPFRAVSCPHCGEELTRQAAVVVASRCCPKCGRRVVAEPEAADPPAFTPEQLDAACGTFARAMSRTAWSFAASPFVLLGGIGAIALFRDTIDAAVRPFAHPGSFSMGLLLVLFLAIVIPGFVPIVRARKAALRCPTCAAPCSLSPEKGFNLTQLTGNCTGCGRKLVEHPPDEPARDLPTVDEYRAARDRATGGVSDEARFYIGVAVVLAVFVAGGVAFVRGDPSQFWIDVENRHGVTGVIWATVGLAAWGLFAFFGVGGVFYWMHRRRQRRAWAEPLLTCPRCRESLWPPSLVVACRRCPKCRAGVLADQPTYTPSSVVSPPNGS